MGVFHRDLQFRNTIKIGEQFKIIDFDTAFVVRKNVDKFGSDCYKLTQEIIKTWLQLDFSKNQQTKQFEMELMQIIFDNLDN